MTINSAQPNDIASPCINNCCLNSQDVCLGCFRHIDEIVAWRSFSPQKKAQVLIDCERRKVNG